MNATSESVIPLYLDRIEDHLAVLVCGEGPLNEWIVPLAWLPVGAQPGDRFTCRIATDPAATSTAVERNRALREGMKERL